MTKIHLGDDLQASLEVLIDTRLLVQASSGAGKSWALRRLLEQSHGKVQHLVIDPEGEFASLRERFDYVLAGRGGETTVEPRAARLLAERLLELTVSAVLDISELKPDARQAFVRQFCEALVEAPRKLWHPVLVVIDEAHHYCPEGKGTECGQAVIDLCSRGRKRGMAPVLATQRLAKLHKDAAAELLNKMIGRTGLDIDLRRACDDLGFGKDRHQDLKRLADGEFFAYGPAISREVVKARVGPVVTTHPKVGARLTFVPPPPTEKVKALLPQLSDLPAEAEKRTRTILALESEIQKLRHELAVRPTVKEPVVERVEVPALPQADRDAFLTACQGVTTSAEQMMVCSGKLREALSALSPPSPEDHVMDAAHYSVPRLSDRTPAQRMRSSMKRDAWGPAKPVLRRGARRMLEVLAARHPDPLTLQQVGMLASVKHTSGTFSAYLSDLRSAGYALRNGDGLHITPEGLAAVGDVRPIGRDEVLGLWRPKLRAGARRMLDALLDAGMDLSTKELGARANIEPSSGTFSAYMSMLRAAGLVVVEHGSVRLSEDLR